MEILLCGNIFESSLLIFEDLLLTKHTYGTSWITSLKLQHLPTDVSGVRKQSSEDLKVSNLFLSLLPGYAGGTTKNPSYDQGAR